MVYTTMVYAQRSLEIAYKSLLITYKSLSNHLQHVQYSECKLYDPLNALHAWWGIGPRCRRAWAAVGVIGNGDTEGTGEGRLHPEVYAVKLL
jgi:hypothetical protein